MNTITITITNNFHNTSAVVRPKIIGQSYLGINSKAVRRAKNNLCGVSGCTCSDVLGARGGIKLELIEIDRNGMHVFSMGG